MGRFRGCGRKIRDAAGVTIKVSDVEGGKRAGFGGVATCGSVWACPVCAAKISAHRQGEIEQALTAWHEQGGRVAMVTLTMRHHAHHSLRELWDVKSYAWNKVTSGRSWQDAQRRWGTPITRTVASGKRKGQTVTEPRLPWIAVTEVTHGVNGWHVHMHVLVLLGPGDASRDVEVEMLGDEMFTRWRDALVRKGFPPPTWEHGVDARVLHGDPSAALGEYFTKANYSAAAELTRADLKGGRDGNRQPFEILRAIVELGDADDLDLWHTWETASRGRRQIAWSLGARALLLGVDVEATDEEIADEDHGGAVAAAVSRPAFKRMHTLRAEVDVLEGFERGSGLPLAVLDSLGLTVRPLPPGECHRVCGDLGGTPGHVCPPEVIVRA